MTYARLLQRIVFVLYLLLGSWIPGAQAADTNANPQQCTSTVVDRSNITLLPITTSSQAQNILQATDKNYTRYGSYCLILENRSGQDFRAALHIEIPRLQHVELLKQDATGLELLAIAGLDYPLHNWETLGGEMLFMIDVPAGSQQQYELNIASMTQYNSYLQILPAQLAMQKLARQQLVTGVLGGIILILTLYTFFLAVSNRDHTYYYLAGTCGFAGLYQLNDLGVFYPLWPDATHWNQIASLVFAVISTTCGTGLIRNYLMTAGVMPKVDKLLKYLAVYLVVFALPAVCTMRDTLHIALYLFPTVLLMLALIVISIIRIHQGYAPARLYLLAILTPIIGGLIGFMNHTSVLPSTQLSFIAPLAGTAIQLLLFALGLGERINWLQLQHEEAEQQALAARTETSAKKNFLAQISHELRTPLAGIIGLAELARKNTVPAGQESLLSGLEDSARHLLDTTNMLLDHARIDAGKWQVKQDHINLQALLQDAIARHKPAAHQKQLEISSIIHGDIPDTLLCDADIIRKVIDNIIDNAIKFTHDGGITVMAEMSSDSRGQPQLRIDVVDTGTGFEELFKARAFELFELADKSTTRIRQGLGLGLSLCKKLCELLGGKIGCDSNPQHGTVFWFSLPVQVASGSTLAADPLSLRQQPVQTVVGRRGNRILVAEDDEALQVIIQSQLESLQRPCHIYPNGRGLIAEYREYPQQISCVVLDWNMPICNAREAIDTIRAFETAQQLTPVPIIVMSAYDAHTTRELDVSSDIKLLQKPVNIEQLSQLLFSVTGIP